MSEIKRISECPMCGGNVLSVDPTSIIHNKCPYCGYELYNHSEEIYGEKIEEVKQAKSKLISVQLFIAIAAIIVVAIAGIFVFNRMVYRHTDQYFEDQSDDITKKMQKAYQKEDWDTLYELVIDNADKSLASPYYYSYRAAWQLSFFVPSFNDGEASGDTESMKLAYRQIKNEYETRRDLEKTNEQLVDLGVDEAYKFIPEIEEELEKEYLREKEIMEKNNLLE